MRELAKNGAESVETDVRQPNGHAPGKTAQEGGILPPRMRTEREIEQRITLLATRYHYVVASESEIIMAQIAALYWVVDPEISWAAIVEAARATTTERLREEGLDASA